MFSFAFVVPAVSAQSSGSQYVVYSVNTSGPNGTLSATVNETVSPSSSGLATVALQVISSNANLSYSRIVNDSETLLPILPTIGTQSITFTRGNTTISASVTQTGTKSVSMSGSSYSVTTYSFSVSVQGSESTLNANGQMAQFASGLVYSVSANINGTQSINAQLLSTNVSLSGNGGGSNTGTTVAVAGGAGGLIAGVGAFAFFRKEKRSPENTSESKPLHWVD